MNAIAANQFESRMLQVAERTAEACGVTVEAMMSEARNRETSQARHIAAYLIYRRLGKSSSQIGRFFGRDHTSILHGIRKTEHALRTQPDVAKVVQGINADFALEDFEVLREAGRADRERLIWRLEKLADGIERTLQQLREELCDETP
ncbi:helix-turn-helix domain-containing protein [Minwuia thermotolerans]|uniref:Chromosomal replication initiator DnaA C-terminal domain-containing protein n=1 Tax=Minwuia thermotolerans TaxID=2056226 RepID=A0A2M9G0T6_9PROT|nr:helix-turn-helix domain-containing protein [Minwuia thermotolerans]PJK29309.1 hypothetical protein CVT23_11945 [Minwuia thermotolerans]PJK30507.1 hypothetical protein CVT23_06055 [Minwuia thermotolerans]PJK30730.1 hypothetical protein CVT23_05005 [Minwuia thermotolerans]